MTQSILIFLELARAGLWGKEVHLLQYGEIDFGLAYRLAQEQSVVGLVAAGLEKVVDVKVPQTIALTMAGEVLQLEQRNRSMNQFVEALVKDLQNNGIRLILLKGQGVAQCYEKPLWRACGDVDLLIDADCFEKAQKLLQARASRYEPLLKDEKHQEFTIESWTVEIHGNQPTHFSKRADVVLEKIQNSTFKKEDTRIWKLGDSDVPLLSPINDVLFVFTHYLKHFFRGGIGLRQICDWCRLLWTYNDVVDAKELESNLREMGLMTEWKAFASLAVNCLGMPQKSIPLYDGSQKWKRKAERIISFIMLTGNFGHNRDASYYKKYPYLIGKFISLNWRVKDNVRYFFIFPLDSLRVFVWLLSHGFKSLVRS